MTTDSAHLIFYNACLDYCKVNLIKVCNMQNNNFMLLRKRFNPSCCQLSAGHELIHIQITFDKITVHIQAVYTS